MHERGIPFSSHFITAKRNVLILPSKSNRTTDTSGKKRRSGPFGAFRIREKSVRLPPLISSNRWKKAQQLLLASKRQATERGLPGEFQRILRLEQDDAQSRLVAPRAAWESLSSRARGFNPNGCNSGRAIGMPVVEFVQLVGSGVNGSSTFARGVYLGRTGEFLL